jgi:hypothetical protein
MSMKIAKQDDQRCEDTFDKLGAVRRCSRLRGHQGKHLCLDDCWIGWTDAGKAAELEERLKAAQQAQ